MNGATCTDGVNTYSCTCAAGYTGDRCQTDIDECDSSPCMNGATCADKVDAYSCECVEGYEGDRCQSDIDDCAKKPCMNGATCTDGVNAYNCSCVAGYTGDRCETDIDECLSDPCQNGGTCKDSKNGYSCKCLDDLYTGTHCETVPKIQIYNGQYKRLKIYTNGYVTFGLAFESRSPSRLNTRMLGYAKRKEA
ncbi:hypothetical protein NP493_2712g00002 [Ridgeia piscesae]|uniref:EGF-like domain-containing protein n=1 Tax=Ridgeia piscesae TaxID=27915 RepID=A0AAD9JDS5_RIDPI|nr:hypothetical protein NP493_2712g00002 [Ridgeia piscesae]